MDASNIFPSFDFGHHNAQDQAENDECPICIEAMNYSATTTYGHKFCPECIASWLQSHNTCPLCRVELVEGNAPLDEPETPEVVQAEPEIPHEPLQHIPIPTERRSELNSSLQTLAVMTIEGEYRQNARRQEGERAEADLDPTVANYRQREADSSFFLITTKMRRLDATLLSFVEVLFPSRKGRPILNNVIKKRDMIKQEITLLAAEYHCDAESEQPTGLSREQFNNFYCSSMLINHRCADLEGGIDRLWSLRCHMQSLIAHGPLDRSLSDRLSAMETRWSEMADALDHVSECLCHILHQPAFQNDELTDPGTAQDPEEGS